MLAMKGSRNGRFGVTFGSSTMMVMFEGGSPGGCFTAGKGCGGPAVAATGGIPGALAGGPFG